MPPDFTQELKEILAHYDLGELVDLEKNERGYINSAFAIHTVRHGQRSRYFLRKYKRGVREEELLFEHSLVDHMLATRTCPVARIHKNRQGQSYVHRRESDDDELGAYYAIFDFLPGEDRYTWVGPRCTLPELANAAVVLAQFHAATSTFRPIGHRVEPKILELLPIIAETWAGCPSKSKGTPFDDCLLENFEPVKADIAATLAALSDPEVHSLPEIVIHCDFHPGNLKYEGDAVVGLFDFDWSKVDLRAFDVALAIWYFFDTWEHPMDGELRLPEVQAFLNAYQGWFQGRPGLGPLSPVELKYLPALISAGNLYVLNWTVLDYFAKPVDPVEYLPYLQHHINFSRWLDAAGNRAALEQLCRLSAQSQQGYAGKVHAGA